MTVHVNIDEALAVNIDEWAWWTNALAGFVAPIHDGEPQTGYYRMKRYGEESWTPVAYWHDTNSGDQRCHVNGRDFNPQYALEIWPYVSKNPVTAEAYAERMNIGKWADESTAVLGHNRAPAVDDAATIAERLDDLAREAERLIAAGAAQSEAISDQASDLANTFGELESKVITLHKAEKQPHLDASRVCDNKWFRLRDRAADFKRRLKAAVVTPFLAKKAAAVEAANVIAIASGVSPDALPQVKLTAGSIKRSTGLRTYYRAEIEDKAKLIDSLKDHPDFVATIQKIADDAAKKKIALPGCRIVDEKRAA